MFVTQSIIWNFFFGEIVSTKSNISLNKKDDLNSVIYFKSGLLAKLKVKFILKNAGIKPIHQLKITTDKNIYFLRSKVDHLSDQFEIIKTDKFLFKNKNNKLDFRIKPTFNNTKKFSSWILKNEVQKPNFFDGQRVHLIIDKMLLSSKKRKKIRIH